MNSEHLKLIKIFILQLQILCAVPDTRQLRLAGSLKGISFDDILYIHFRKIFSTLSVDKLDESKLTSLEEKAVSTSFFICNSNWI